MEFFYGGWDGTHGSSQQTAAIGLATLPRDRFVAISPSDEMATIETTTFVLDENQGLTINADATEGQIRAAVLDADGNVLPGFGLADCSPIASDVFRQPLVCGGSPDLSMLAETEISLFFEIDAGAELFSVRMGLLAEPPLLLADFDNNGVVEAADYVVWRNNVGGPRRNAGQRSHRAAYWRRAIPPLEGQLRDHGGQRIVIERTRPRTGECIPKGLGVSFGIYSLPSSGVYSSKHDRL